MKSSVEHGALVNTAEDWRPAVELIASGEIIMEPWTSKHVPFESYLEAHCFID